jgi:hypothetical protein
MDFAAHPSMSKNVDSANAWGWQKIGTRRHRSGFIEAVLCPWHYRRASRSDALTAIPLQIPL